MGCCYKNWNKNDDYTNINYIDAEIEITEKDVYEDIRIINTIEESRRKYHLNIEDHYKNEKEIKNNCVIEIGGVNVGFK